MYLDEDTDLVEVRDSSSKVNVYTVAKVLAVIAAPFLIATGIAFTAVKADHYGNIFTSWFTIFITGSASVAGWIFLHTSDKFRTEYPWNWAVLSAVCLATAAFLGGFFSHSYLLVSMLAGVCVATTSMAVAAAMTSAMNKSRRLR